MVSVTNSGDTPGSLESNCGGGHSRKVIGPTFSNNPTNMDAVFRPFVNLGLRFILFHYAPLLLAVSFALVPLGTIVR